MILNTVYNIMYTYDDSKNGGTDWAYGMMGGFFLDKAEAEAKAEEFNKNPHEDGWKSEYAKYWVDENKMDEDLIKNRVFN